VIENGGPLEETERRVKGVWEQLTAKAPS